MGYIIVSIILTLVGIFLPKFFEDTDQFERKMARFIPFGMIALLTIIFSIKIIPVGHEGIVFRFGNVVGQRSSGLQTIAPWENIKKMDCRLSSHKFEQMVCFSKETQEVFVSATLNCRVSPVAIQKLVKEVGINWFAILVEPRVSQLFKDETVKFNSVDIAPNREQIRHEVTSRLDKDLSQWSIKVDDLLLDNIDFKPEFKNSIEQKQIATQTALKEEQNIKVREFLAKQASATAAGIADSLFIVAEGQSRANYELSKSLTPNIIQYAAIQKLNPNVNAIILPSDNNLILETKSFINH